MADSDYDNAGVTRALQASENARKANMESMQRWGAYSLLKVMPAGSLQSTVAGYVTTMPAISGKSPRQMETILGLRHGQLAGGADIYRLLELPQLDGFLPRGYTTLVDGLHLKAGLTQDSGGYRPGHGAWQIVLIKPLRATRIASLKADQPFEPGVHPSLRR